MENLHLFVEALVVGADKENARFGIVGVLDLVDPFVLLIGKELEGDGVTKVLFQTLVTVVGEERGELVPRFLRDELRQTGGRLRALLRKDRNGNEQNQND